MPAQDQTTTCSFCNKNGSEVKKIIHGPSTNICNECAAFCNEILIEEEIEAAKEAVTKPTKIVIIQPETLEFIRFTELLALLIQAGMPIISSLEILSTDKHLGGLRAITLLLAREMNQGKTFTEALREHPEVFDELYVSVVEIGESEGILDSFLSRLAEFLNKERELFQVKHQQNPEWSKKVNTTIMFRTLALCTGCSIPVTKSLEIAAAKIPAFANFIEKVRRDVSDGKNLSEAMNKHGDYLTISHFMSVGEQTGSLDQMLHKIAEFFYEKELGLA